MSHLELPPFRILIDQVAPFVRNHFRHLFVPIALPLIVATTSIALVQRQWMVAFTADPLASLGITMWMLVLVFAMAALMAVVYTVVTVVSIDALEGRPVSITRAWRIALRWRALWTVALVSIATMASLMMCVVPAFLVVPLVSLTLPAMVVEERSGVDAMKRSVQLAWWNGTGRMADSGVLQVGLFLVVGWVVQNALTFVVQGPFLVVQQLATFRQAAGGVEPNMAEAMGPLWLHMATQILGGAVAAVASLFWACGLAMLFFELRRRREAKDLGEAIDALITPVETLPASGQLSPL